MEKETQKQMREGQNASFQNNTNNACDGSCSRTKTENCPSTKTGTCSRTRINKIYAYQAKKQAEEARKKQELEREK